MTTNTGETVCERLTKNWYHVQMVDPGRLATFILVIVILIVIPGPSVLFVVSRGVTLGRRAAVVTAFGNEAGLLLQLVAVALGLGAVLEKSETVLTVIRLLGAVYLLYLGVQAWRHRSELRVEAVAKVDRYRQPQVLREGFIVGVTNPKGLLIFTAIVPQFIDRQLGHASIQLFLMGCICIMIALISDATWGMLAGTAQVWLAKSPRRLELIGGAAGLIMIGLGVQLAFSTGLADDLALHA